MKKTGKSLTHLILLSFVTSLCCLISSASLDDTSLAPSYIQIGSSNFSMLLPYLSYPSHSIISSIFATFTIILLTLCATHYIYALFAYEYLEDLIADYQESKDNTIQDIPHPLLPDDNIPKDWISDQNY